MKKKTEEESIIDRKGKGIIFRNHPSRQTTMSTVGDISRLPDNTPVYLIVNKQRFKVMNLRIKYLGDNTDFPGFFFDLGILPVQKNQVIRTDYIPMDSSTLDTVLKNLLLIPQVTSLNWFAIPQVNELVQTGKIYIKEDNKTDHFQYDASTANIIKKLKEKNLI